LVYPWRPARTSLRPSTTTTTPRTPCAISSPFWAAIHCNSHTASWPNRLPERPNQDLVKAEERYRKGRPREPRPQLHPARHRFIRLDLKPEKGRPVRPCHGNLHIPPARFR